MSRENKDAYRVVSHIEPARRTGGCFGRAQESAPVLAMCIPCCDYPATLAAPRDGSAYVSVRENCIEWNQPSIVCQEGGLLGVHLNKVGLSTHIIAISASRWACFCSMFVVHIAAAYRYLMLMMVVVQLAALAFNDANTPCTCMEHSINSCAGN